MYSTVNVTGGLLKLNSLVWKVEEFSGWSSPDVILLDLVSSFAVSHIVYVAST